MKILLINGQNHKGSTYHIGRMLADKLSTNENIKEIFLPKDMPHFCCGCTQCFMVSESKCPHYEVISPITRLMDEADLLIFTSPVYVYHTTGSMKAFLDHYGYRWIVHRPEEKMFQKQAVVISTAAGAGMKSTCKDIADSCFFWGIAKTYKYGVAVYAVSWAEVSKEKKKKIAKDMNKLAITIKRKHGNVSPDLKTKAFFSIMKIAQKKGWNQADAAYWKQKKWTDGKKPWKVH